VWIWREGEAEGEEGAGELEWNAMERGDDDCTHCNHTLQPTAATTHLHAHQHLLRMEPILIFYQILASGELAPPSLSEEYNCYELHTHSQKEILLIDILTAWATWLPDLGTSFNFYTTYSPSNGASGGHFHHLASPASCVPVINQTIYLYLTPSAAAFPFTPIEQAIAFYDKSSREIYGTSSTISAARPVSLKRRVEGKGKPTNDKPAVSRPSPAPQQRTPSSSAPSAEFTSSPVTAAAPKKSKPAVPVTTRAEDSDRPIHSSRERPSRPEKGSSPTTAAATQGGGATGSLDIASIEAASQAGMEAAGVAARSFLNFAASTLMTVVNTSLSFTAGNILQVSRVLCLLFSLLCFHLTLPPTDRLGSIV
jgi:hypothetical protein